MLIAENIIKASSELLKNGEGDYYYRNQEQIARAIELGKFLSSKKEIAAADDVRLFRIKEDILQYMSRGMPKRAYGGFWYTWSKFDRGKKMMKSAHTIGISNNLSSKTCSYLIYPMHYKMASIALFFHFKWNRKDGRASYPYGEITANTTIIIAASSTLLSSFVSYITIG